ncbi:MAG: polyprenyl synthetase family protein [Rickettsiales bacterium]|nr:polyprenyl synthetase family protein [Rickettsiales bacterium]
MQNDSEKRMSQTTALQAPKTATLDALYALIKDDLKRVDACILDRVNSEIPLIHDIARHIVASGGKRIRPALTLISAQLCGYTGPRHIALAAAVEFIHTATLLHDDVVDESKLRRGLATANELFGNKASVLVGDFLLSQAFQLMVADGELKTLKILSDAAAVISKGEVMQLMTEGQPETTIENYLQVISSKTAVLFAAACELGAVVAAEPDAENALREFGIYIGIAFQLVDDALDYAADQATLGKSIGDDFHEGKITLPVILSYAAGSREERVFWIRTLSDLEQTPEDFDEALALIHKHRGIEQTLQMAERYCAKAKQSLAIFADCKAKSAMLDIVDFCISRAY